MNIKFTTKADASTPTLIALFEDDKPNKKMLGKSKEEALNVLIKSKAFTGKKGSSTNTHLLSGTNRSQRIMLFGLGKRGEWNEKEARNKGAKIIRAVQSFKEPTVSIAIPETVQNTLEAFTEGIIMGNYDPALYKTGKETKKKEKKAIKTLYLIAPSWNKEQENTVEKGQNTAEVINYTRNIVNCGPNQLTISAFVAEIKDTAKENGYRLTVLNKRKLEKLNMGGLLAVNRGSEEPAHMMILEHNANLKEKPIVIAGKGIIFDTGGINLKPSGHIHEMQLDMAGAAAVLGTFKLLKKHGIKRKVIGVIPITDNAIGPHAYNPSDIITTYSGKTVEIKNTDAEGRMILSDALAYASEQFKPRYMIDMATLTGACVVALGYRTAGLFGNDQELIDLIQEASKRTDEPTCHLPITKADEKSMEGKLADLTNLADAPVAGASRAAAFLKNFIGDSKWAHIDLAGPAFTKEPKPYEVNMGTGFGVRLMIDFLENL